MAAGERARRRELRDREAAAAAAAQQVEAQRRTRRAARRTAVTRWTRWVPGSAPATGPLAERHRQQTALAAALVVTANALTFLGTSSWAPRVTVLLLTVSLAPIVLTLMRK